MDNPAGETKIRPRLIIALIVFTLLLQLNYQAQPWFSQDGSILIWSGDAWGKDASQHFLDPYSFTHMLHGVLFCGILALILPKLHWRWRLAAAVLLEALWEMLENTNYIVDKYRETTASQEYLGDTIFNSFGDVVACATGFLIALRIGWKWSVALYIAVEVFLILWIRDSLTINIIMLLYPIESLKQWQLGH